MLSDSEARIAVESGQITILRDGLPVNGFRGCSIDLTLADEFYEWKHPTPLYGKRELDLATLKQDDFVRLLRHVPNSDGNGIVIKPNDFILTRSRERLRLSGEIAGLLTGRSSYGRFGISVEFSANLVSPGHNDHIPLQICNHTPYSIIIYPGTPICQIVFFRFSQASEIPYNVDPRSKYVGSGSALLPKWYEDANLKTRPPKKPSKSVDIAMLLNASLLISTALTAGLGLVPALAPQVDPTYIKVLGGPGLGLMILIGFLRIAVFIKDVVKRS